MSASSCLKALCSLTIKCRVLAQVKRKQHTDQPSFVDFAFEQNVSLGKTVCDVELEFNGLNPNSSFSLMIFCRSVFIFIKNDNLFTPNRVLSQTVFDRFYQIRWAPSMRPHNVIQRCSMVEESCQLYRDVGLAWICSIFSGSHIRR